MADASEPTGRVAPTRGFLGWAGGWLVLLGGVTFAWLRGLSDNAYLWLLPVALLAPVGLLFLLGAALPAGARRWAWYGGLGLLWLVGAASGLLCAFALVILVFQPRTGPAVFASYTVGLLLVAGSLYWIGVRPLRTPSR